MTELEKAAERYCNQSYYNLGIESAFIAGAEWAIQREIERAKQVQPPPQQSEDVERILCAACYFPDGKYYNHQPRNVETGFVVSGWRHHNCITLADLIIRGIVLNSYTREDHIKYRNMEIQGFLTTFGNFVDRKDAAKIAFSAGQISDPKDELYSEDLY